MQVQTGLFDGEALYLSEVSIPSGRHGILKTQLIVMSALFDPYEFLIDLGFRNDFYCIRLFQKTSILEAISTLHEADIVVLV